MQQNGQCQSLVRASLLFLIVAAWSMLADGGVRVAWGQAVAEASLDAGAEATPIEPAETVVEPVSAPEPEPEIEDETKPAPAVDEKGPTVELDLLTFLVDVGTANTSVVEEAVWMIRPKPGMVLVQMPVFIKPGETEGMLSTRALRLRGGRFLAWKLSPPKARSQKGSELERQIEASIPDGAPTLTTKLTVTTDGKIKWPLDRFIPNAQVVPSKRTYAFRLDQKLLEKENPGAPTNLKRNGNEDYQKFQARRDTALAQYRDRASAYRDLLKQVRELPTEFTAPAPNRIWAIFELNNINSDLHFLGQPPLPWQINRVDMVEMRRYYTPFPKSASPKAGVGVSETAQPLPRLAQDMVARMSGVIADKHPYNLRVVAYTIAESQLVPLAQPDDTLFKLLDTILRSDDTLSRQIIFKELIRTVPPTPATLALIKAVSRDMDPSSQLLSLRGILKIDRESDTARMGETAAEINRLLVDPKGPPAGDVAQAMLDAAKAQPALVSQLAVRVRLDNLVPERFDAAAAAIIQAAPDNELARVLLDTKLIGASETAIIERSLEILAHATDASAAAPAQGADAGGMMNQLIGGFFGGSGGNTSSTRRMPRVKLAGPIFIDSPSHSLFRALQSGQPQIRELSWRAIERFTFAEPTDKSAQAGRGKATTNAEPSPLHSALLDAALAQSPTPPQVIHPLASQKEPFRSASSMIRLILRASDQTSITATKTLLASGAKWPLDRAMTSLSFGDMSAFASRMYYNQYGSAPFVTDLLRQRIESNPVAAWFGKELSTGHLPMPSVWAAQYPSRDVLIEMSVSNDQDLARAAVAALLASVGGDDTDVPDSLDQLRKLPDQSLGNLRKQWPLIQASAIVKRVQRAAGNYQMIFRLAELGYRPPQVAKGQTAPPIPMSEIDLGTIQLVAEGETIRMTNQTLKLSILKDQAVIRIDKAMELMDFKNEKLTGLRIEQMKTAILLFPQSDGTWVGNFSLPGERPAQIVLRRAK